MVTPFYSFSFFSHRFDEFSHHVHRLYVSQTEEVMLVTLSLTESPIIHLPWNFLYWGTFSSIIHSAHIALVDITQFRSF